MKEKKNKKIPGYQKMRVVGSVVFTVGIFTTYIGLSGLETSTVTPAIVSAFGILICFIGNRLLEGAEDLERESRK